MEDEDDNGEERSDDDGDDEDKGEGVCDGNEDGIVDIPWCIGDEDDSHTTINRGN